MTTPDYRSLAEEESMLGNAPTSAASRRAYREFARSNCAKFARRVIELESAVAAEREACATLADSLALRSSCNHCNATYYVEELADDIRARSQP